MLTAVLQTFAVCLMVDIPSTMYCKTARKTRNCEHITITRRTHKAIDLLFAPSS